MHKDYNNIDSDAMYKYIGRKIRTERKRIGITGEEFGRMINVSQQQVSRYENGDCKISLEKLILVADVLNINITSFLDCIIVDAFNYSTNLVSINK